MISSLLDNNGGLWVRAADVVCALGYNRGASAVSQKVDADRHCSLQDLLDKVDFDAAYFKPTVGNLTKAEKEAHWLSESSFYQLLMR